jgi:hypothetical protein
MSQIDASQTQHICTRDALVNYLSDEQHSHLRLMYVRINQLAVLATAYQLDSQIHSERTISPLQITSEGMFLIFQKYKIREDFLRIVLSFTNTPDTSDARNSSLAHYVLEDGCERVPRQ